MTIRLIYYLDFIRLYLVFGLKGSFRCAIDKSLKHNLSLLKATFITYETPEREVLLYQ